MNGDSVGSIANKSEKAIFPSPVRGRRKTRSPTAIESDPFGMKGILTVVSNSDWTHYPKISVCRIGTSQLKELLATKVLVYTLAPLRVA